LDIAKHVFQAHGVDASGHAILRKKIKRSKLLPFFSTHPPCLVVLEACVSTAL
jgi:transposase